MYCWCGNDKELHISIDRRQLRAEVLSNDVLPEFIVDETFYTVTSKAKIHIFLSSKIHIVLVMQIKTKKNIANVNTVIKVVDKA